jgi:hypothetical protein
MLNNPTLNDDSATRSVAAGQVRDDRVLPETRALGIIIPPFLIAAFLILYLLPDHTKDFFAWGIKPNMTPLLMGGGYISGGYYFYRVLRAPRWHLIGLGLLPITAFTWFMGLSTILHWDKFTPGHISFYAWAVLYFITPIIVPIVWFRNRAYDPGTPDPGDVIVPRQVRLAVGTVGGIILAIAVFLFLTPSFAPDILVNTTTSIWPWDLTPLTARVIGGWFALPGVVGLCFASDRRWSAWRITLQSQLIGILLILFAVPRAWGDFHTDRPMTWVFLVGMALLWLSLLAVYITFEGRRRQVALSAPAQA